MKKLMTISTFQKSFAASVMICAVTSTSALAHQSCEVDLSAGISINNRSIEFFADTASDKDKPAESLYEIIGDNQLVIDDDAVKLTAEQQILVRDYATSIRTLVPQVKTLAIEGVDLAIDGVDLAFNQLLGQGNDVSSQLNQELLLVREAIDNKLSIEKGITFGLNGTDGQDMMNDLMGEEFEQRIESVVEKAVMSSMGSLLVALGQEMLFSGGDSDAFETRMEKFGDDIANQMEARAEKLELKAEQLCLEIQKIDLLEEQLKLEVDELAHINILTTKVDLSHNDEAEKKHKNLM